jgi:hypothetical protein
VTHRTQTLLGIVHLQLTQILEGGAALLLCSLLHVLLRSSLLLRFVDVGIPSATVGGISKSIDFNLAGSELVLEEGLREVPTG